MLCPFEILLELKAEGPFVRLRSLPICITLSVSTVPISSIPQILLIHVIQW